MASKIGFIWVYVILTLFCVGVIELVLMPAIEFQLVPVLRTSANQTLSSADAADFAAKTTQTLGFMHIAMYVIFGVLIFYAILSIFQREENEFYQP